MRTPYEPIVEYEGLGNLAEYSFDFKIESLTQLLVIEIDDTGVETQRVRGDDITYLSSVEFDAVEGGGTVNLQANLPTNYRLLILQANDAPTQPYRFREKFSFTLKSFEMALDYLGGAIQRLAWLAGRAIRIHDATSEDIDPQLPIDFFQTAGNVPMVNATNDGFTAINRTNLKGDKGDTGDQGPQGPDGLSAYEVAVANGFVGTEAAWLLSLQGTDGVDGADGTAATNAHIADPTDAHMASAIGNSPSGNLAATDVQGALNELQSDIDTRATASALATDVANLATHIANPTGAHAASAISNTPSGNLASTDAQSALNELQSDIDTRATSAALAAHIAATTTHGTTGTIVGTSDAQVLTNKDIDGGTAANNRRITIPQNSYSNLSGLTRKKATLLYDTTSDSLYVDDGTNLRPVGAGITVVADTTARNAIASGIRFEGMLVYVVANQITYQLEGGITNSNWYAITNQAIANMTVDSFSGNGATTAFTLSSTPASINNTWVFVHGVYQQKSTYTVVGTTLTFSTAPPSGTNNVQVVTGSTAAIGVPSDYCVGKTQLALLPPRSATSTDTATRADRTILCSGASFTANFYSAVGCSGERIKYVHRGTSLTQVYTLTPQPGEFLYLPSGAVASAGMYTAGETWEFESNGVGWVQVQHDTLTEWATINGVSFDGTSAAPVKASSPTVDRVRWMRIGDSARIRQEYYAANKAGASNGSGDYLWFQPTNLLIDVSKASTNTNILGWNVYCDRAFTVGSATFGNGTTNGKGDVVVWDTNYVRVFGLTATQTGVIDGTGGFGINVANGVYYILDYVVPITNWKA